MNQEEQHPSGVILKETEASSVPRTGYVFRDAFRLLAILVLGSKPLEVNDPSTGADSVFIGEKRRCPVKISERSFIMSRLPSRRRMVYRSWLVPSPVLNLSTEFFRSAADTPGMMTFCFEV